MVSLFFSSSYSATLLPRVNGPAPDILCENSEFIYDYSGQSIIAAGTPVDIKGKYFSNSLGFASTGGFFKATYFIRTRRVNNNPIFDLAIVQGTVNSVNWNSNSSNILFKFGNQANNGISSIDMTTTFQTANGSLIKDLGVRSVTMGWKPSFGIQGNDASFNFNWLTKLTPSCVGDEINIKSLGLNCSSPEIGLAVRELQYNHVDHVFSSVGDEFSLNGFLSAQEIIALNSTFGLDVADIVDDAVRSSTGSTTITFNPGSYYSIKLINTDHNRWQETIKFIQVSDQRWDLVLKGNTADKGQEPIDPWARDLFTSPYIWNRLDDGITVPSDYSKHEDLDFINTAGNSNKIFYEVENVGCEASPAGETLRLYWTRARTNEKWDNDWIYDLTNNGIDHPTDPIKVPLGAEITIPNPQNGIYVKATTPNPDAIVLPSIAAAGGIYTPDWINGTEWFPPNNDWYEYSQTSHLDWRQADQRNIICLLAKIGETVSVNPSSMDPIVWEGEATKYVFPEVPISEMLANNNNINTRNTILVENSSFFVGHNNGDWDYGYGTVLVPNATSSVRNIDLCLDIVPHSFQTDFLDYGDVYIGVTDDLWTSWLSNSSIPLTNAVVVEPGLFKSTSGSHVCINDIDVTVNSVEQVGVRFLYDGTATLPSNVERYEYRLTEVDRSEVPVPGSATVFQVDVPSTPTIPLFKRDAEQTSTTALNSNLEMTVYPNPAKNKLIVGVQADLGTEYIIKLVDISGKVLEKIDGTTDVEKFSKVLDVQSYRSSIYYIELVANGVKKQQKVIISN